MAPPVDPSAPPDRSPDLSLDPDRFTIHRAEVAPDLALAYVREGAGGYPLVLLHGYPETMRIWWRNIEPLAAVGFDVVVPDLRGFGLSDVAPDGFYDPAAFAADVHRLVTDVLGLARCSVVAGDLGGVVAQQLSLRYDGFVDRLCLFNTVVPELGPAYEEAGVAPDPPRGARPTADYFLRQGGDADALAAELDTPERRRAYIADFYGHRLWASPGAFTPEAVDFMTEPFADAAHLRASWGCYEVALGARPVSEVPRIFERNPTPTLVLYGVDDHVVWRSFPDKCRVAFPEIVGPFEVQRAGHFLQWEAAELLNRTIGYFFADLRTAAAPPTRSTR
jgi:pimeloyl-ACP methyl ester carboxylesterase